MILNSSFRTKQPNHFDLQQGQFSIRDSSWGNPPFPLAFVPLFSCSSVSFIFQFVEEAHEWVSFVGKVVIPANDLMVKSDVGNWFHCHTALTVIS